MALAISPIYLGLAALLLVVLSMRVVLARQKFKVGLGAGGQHELEKRIRAHGNCAEYLPAMMILTIAIELVGAPGWVVHLFGIGAVASRVFHAIALSMTGGASIFRGVGMIGTYAVLILGGIGLIGHALV